MKILYAIQGTGNGHVARAKELIPVLNEYADVDILLSGSQCELSLPWPVKFRLKGLGFVFGKTGGIDYKATFSSNSIFSLIREIWQLPVQKYDLVISDFEPVSAWACMLRGKKCIGISHQSSILHKDAPQPEKKDFFGRFILKYYAPVHKAYGFHFKALGRNISTPVIRKDVRYSRPVSKGHYTVYLPAYDDLKIIDFLSRFRDVKWEVFSKHAKNSYSFQDIKIRPVNQAEFTKSMVYSKGVFCTAGFETPAEALFLGKKLCVVPMRGQYEQVCNAAMLESMGVTVIKNLKKNNIKLFSDWIVNDVRVQVKYPDNTQSLIERILVEVSGLQIEHFPMAGAFLMPAR
jgi:uncharacterized protein (TIGR00661 family)